MLREQGQNEQKFFFIQCNILRDEDCLKVTSSKFVVTKDWYTYE